MAIDDPSGIVIRQARDEVAEASDLPSCLVRLGVSGAIAAVLVKYPFVSQVLISLLANSTSRFEKRFLAVAEELDVQQKRIEKKIPDERYYSSEGFQTLIGLIIERLHTTHDREKLRMFGRALANSGSDEFQADDREQLIRVLRDLSPAELQMLSKFQGNQTATPANPESYSSAQITCLSRLASMGLVHDRRISGFDGGPPAGRDRIYLLSDFGATFLAFISDGSEPQKRADVHPGGENHPDA
jgi:hypothetical protein